MNHFTVVMIALLIPATAMAAGECRQDRQKFCKGAAYIGACLDKHKAELTENCRAKREEMANAKKGSEEPAKMGKEEGAQPLTKESCKTAGMEWDDKAMSAEGRLPERRLRPSAHYVVARFCS